MTEDIDERVVEEAILADPNAPGAGMPFKSDPRIQVAISHKDEIDLARISDAWYSKTLHHRLDILTLGMILGRKSDGQECWMARKGEFTYFFVGSVPDVEGRIKNAMPSWDSVHIPDSM